MRKIQSPYFILVVMIAFSGNLNAYDSNLKIEELLKPQNCLTGAL
jgi:hypothetical protein